MSGYSPRRSTKTTTMDDSDAAMIWVWEQRGDLSPAELVLFIHIAREGARRGVAHAKISDLAERMNVSEPTVSRLIDRLCDLGLIDRLRDRLSRAEIIGLGPDMGAGMYRVRGYHAGA